MGTLYNIDGNTGNVQFPKARITPEGGYAILVLNNTGVTINKGAVVKASTLTDDAVVLTALSDQDPVGIVYENILTGQTGWLVVAGFAEVFVDNAGAVTREQWVGVSTVTPGQCTASTIPPLISDHLREIGHTVRARTGPGLVMCIIHFL